MMKNTEEGWGDFTFVVPKTNAFLTLPDCIKEHICRFLTNRNDQLEACLIHPQWVTSAQAILWERPRFERPNNFRLFMETIQKNKKCALMVQDVQLTILDKHSNLFKPIVKSTLERHNTPNKLRNPNAMLHVASHCQRITALEIYGWELKTKQIEILSTYANHLTSLYIVGADPDSNMGNAPPISLNSLFPRLTTLRLDGEFNLNSTWASALVNRATRLTCLQLSLMGMEHKTMDTICSSSPAGLTELTLTDAIPLTDLYISNMIRAFPKLTRLCLDGCTRISCLSVAYILRTCLDLQDLEIRVINETLEPEMGDIHVQLQDYFSQQHQTAKPIRFVLENMAISDTQMELLGPSLVHIQVLGLKGCSQLTNQCLENTMIKNKSKYLHTVEIVDCPKIDSSVLSLFSDSYTIPLSIMKLYVGYCGEILPKDIYRLCCSGIEHNLREIRIVGYPHLDASVIGTFNEDHEGGSILLNRRSIDALSHAIDPELFDIPADRYLTSKQLLILARMLNMSSEALVSLLDLVQEEEEEADEILSLGNEYIAPSSAHVTQMNPLDRLKALRTSSTDQRPNTPAIWSNDYNTITTSPKHASFPEQMDHNLVSSSLQIVTSSESSSESIDDVEESDDKTMADYGEEGNYGYNNNDDEDDDEEEEEEKEDPNLAINTTASNISPTWTTEISGQEINLGGWGVGNGDAWNTTFIPTTLPLDSNNATPQPLSFRHVQQQQDQQQQHQQQQQQQDGTAWSNFREETYRDKWTQNSLEVNLYATKVRKNPRTSHHRNNPAVIESEGWGSCNTFIPWEDVKEQGYVKEVLEEQKATTYWHQDGAEWIPLSGEAAATSSVEDPANNPRPRRHRDARAISITSSDEDYPVLSGGTTPSLIQGSPPVSFSDFRENVHNSIKMGRNSSFQHTAQSNNTTGRIRPRSDSVVSSDASVSWNEKDNVVVKVHTDDKPSYKKTQLDQKDQSKWASAADWKMRKDALATPVKEATPKSSWQDNFDPEVIESKGAKNEWSSLTSPSRRTFSRPLRTATPHRPSAPPPRPIASPSPPPPTRHVAPPSGFLIDTENSPPSNSSKNGDVWDSINYLNAPDPMNHVLVPNEVNHAEPTSIEIIDWVLEQETASNANNENIPQPVRFQQTILGTITSLEEEQKQKEQDKDNLVSFDDVPSDLLSSSQPVIVTPTDDMVDLVSFSGSDSSKTSPQQQLEVQPESTQEQVDSPAVISLPQTKSKPLSIKVLVKDGYLTLIIPTEEQSYDAVAQFCQKHDCMEFFDNVYKLAKERWTARHTKLILGRKKVKKTSKQGSSDV